MSFENLNLNTISLKAAQRAINNGAVLIKLEENFTTKSGVEYSHILRSNRGNTYRVSWRIAHFLQVPQRGKMQCQASGCEGCSVCGYPLGYMQQRGAA